MRASPRRPAAAGALFSGTLWFGNAAYTYLSVSFIQMLKALMPAAVYTCSVLWVRRPRAPARPKRRKRRPRARRRAIKTRGRCAFKYSRAAARARRRPERRALGAGS